ncbi:MAG: methyltransferase domain-containing protein [Gammaproteobacteria bacterium]|nr:methyltransferase domain-containing protein [Gammaproteobacteria bacterium]
MSFAAAKLFDWLQGADFYHAAHRAAVEQLPPGGGKLWVDVGCGPGLVTRLAAARGYRAIGVDRDRHMIAAAQRRAARAASAAAFQIGDIDGLAAMPARADVISAASLLAVVDDPAAALTALLAAVKPGGCVLVIEPTAAMTPAAADTLIGHGLGGKRVNGLRLWARARHGRAINPDLFDMARANAVHYAPVLAGLLGVWMLRTAAAQ